MNTNLISYYNDRAPEYDKVYLNPLEQDDLSAATRRLQDLFARKTVLEIACGTGYWTERMAQTALFVDATDANETMLHIARGRQQQPNINYTAADMYQLNPDKRYEGLFGGFIWSHILLQDLDALLNKLHTLLKPGATMVFMDSNPVKNTPHDTLNISHTDEYGNTFQTRTLDNGATHLVLKNFPPEAFLLQKLSQVATEVVVTQLEYYWMLSGKAK